MKALATGFLVGMLILGLVSIWATRVPPWERHIDGEVSDGT